MLLITDDKRVIFLPTLGRSDRFLSAFNKDPREITIDEIITFLQEYAIPYREVETIEIAYTPPKYSTDTNSTSSITWNEILR